MEAQANTTLTVDPLAQEVQVNGETVSLGRGEYRLIEELSVTPLTGISYRDLAASLSSIRGPVTTRQVKATVSSARRKLRAAGVKSPLPDVAGIGLKLGR